MTDTYGLPATATVSVTVFAAPTVQIVPSGEALTAQPLSFKVTSSTPEGTNLTDYQVSYGDGTAIQYGDGTPAATLSHTFGTPGVYTVILDAFNDADGHATSTVVVTIADVDSTAPGPVTALRTSAVTPASVALAWTNPTDTDFAGVTIRREDGATPPLSVSDGMAIADLSSAASTFTDATVSSGIRYSYAVFAHDGIPNAAAAATLTVTAHNPPSAQLAGPARLTVDQQTSFDASGSSADDGFTLVSAVLDRRRFGAGSLHRAPATWQAAHTYQDVGADVATLTVTDSGNLTATIAVPVTVSRRRPRRLHPTVRPRSAYRRPSRRPFPRRLEPRSPTRRSAMTTARPSNRSRDRNGRR